MSSNSPRRRGITEMPNGTEVASFRKYEDAVTAVELLGSEGFALEAVTIVGSDLHLVEQVQGKLTPARVALSGASQGMIWGLMLGFISMLAFPTGGLLIATIAVCVGILGGVLFAVVGWSANANKRTFAARSALVASRYAVLVSQEAERAFNLLSGLAGNLNQAPRRPARSAARVEADQRAARSASSAPKYGVRLDREAKDEPRPQKGDEPTAPNQDQAD